MKRLSWLLFAVTVGALGAIANAQPVTIVVNGQTMSFTQPPIERAGRVFVPLRGIFEQLGASVVYSSGQINATAHGRTVSLTIGSTQAEVGGQPTTLDVAPFIVGATTFVPLRFISQALGARVDWDNSTSTVTISGGRPGPPPPPYGAPPPRPPRAPYFISQSPTGTIYNPTPALRFAFNRPVALERLRVFVDGNRIPGAARQSAPNSFVVNVPWPLARGPHRVRVTGVTAAGDTFDLSWSFVRG